MLSYYYLLLLLNIQTYKNDCYRSSVSQNFYSYPRFCELAARDESTFQSFRRDSSYRAIVETVSYEQGLTFAHAINNHYQYLLPYLNKICADDIIGTPINYFFHGIGSCSPTILRYIKIAGDLHKEFGDLNSLKIVEIGGGFGGQCKILHDTFGFQSYTIIDLPQCTPLINKYLSHFGIKNYYTINNLALNEPQQYDLVISNYAFSEIDRDEQLKYIEMIINLTPRGYMIYNLMPSVNPLSLNEFSSIISQTKKIRIEREFPSTGDDNYTIIWHP